MRRTSNAAALLLLLTACGRSERSTPSPSPSVGARPAPVAIASDLFEQWLHVEFPAADGFDTARGAGETEVRSVAHGRVAFARDCGLTQGHFVVVDHVYYENHERRAIRSVYGLLAASVVQPGQVVRRGDVIGTVDHDTGDARLLRLRRDVTAPNCAPGGSDGAGDPEPSAFIASHRHLHVPQDEAALLLVSTRERKMRVWLKGEMAGDYEVGFGQEEGRKRRQGDLRTPLGMYFVVGKSRGPFDGAYGGYYGGHWIKVNYPNGYDAAWGQEQGLVAESAARTIGEAWSKRKPTWQGSPLGGGIGFHGWAEDWALEGPRQLSWGCVVLRTEDIRVLFPRIPFGAMVVIL